MSTPRFNHTAVLLFSQGVKVLVAGGNDGTGSLASAELYDRTTGTWSPTGSMATVRTEHTATQVFNGKVLVTGGFIAIGGSGGSAGALSSAELYDPRTGSWSLTGSMATARESHTATLLPNGKVLVAGGSDRACGGGGCGPFFSAELYDPRTGTWSPTGSMTTHRRKHTATLLLNGKVLVTGGPGAPELYDPRTGTWSTTGNIAAALEHHTATLLLNGKVLVAGGSLGGGLTSPTSSATLYDPRTGGWSTTGSMITPRAGHTASLLPNGKVMVAGGRTSGGTDEASAEVYDPATGAWSPEASMTDHRALHTATLLLNGKVLVAGPGTRAELYDRSP